MSPQATYSVMFSADSCALMAYWLPSSSSIVKWADAPGSVVAFWRMVGAVVLWWVVIAGRRALSGLDPERLKESEDPLALRAAAIALVPLSLAGSGERLATDVPPLLARAVVAEGAPHAQAATSFVRFLASEPGQRAFAACGSPQP